LWFPRKNRIPSLARQNDTSGIGEERGGTAKNGAAGVKERGFFLFLAVRGTSSEKK
jgi:hypothetical protein